MDKPSAMQYPLFLANYSAAIGLTIIAFYLISQEATHAKKRENI